MLLTGEEPEVKLAHWDKYCTSLGNGHGSILRWEWKLQILKLKSMFANQKCGPLHNSSTCVQCIPQMPAEVVPYQSLQLFWCVAQRPPCPPLHRAGMCSLWDSRLWERPVPPRCPAPPPLHSTVCDLFNETWKISHQQLCLLSPRKLVTTRQQLQGHFTNRVHQWEHDATV